MDCKKLVMLLGLTACGHSYIAGTTVEASDQNQEVYAVVQRVNAALQARDVNAVLAEVSPEYFEDNGTEQPEDDYGFAELKDKILPESLSIAQEFYIQYLVQSIAVQDNHASADLRYNSRARLQMANGSTWDKHEELNRMEFAKTDAGWRIISGL